MTDRPIPAVDDDGAALDAERRLRKRRIVRLSLAVDAAIILAVVLFIYIAGSSFHETVRDHDMVAIIVLKDPQDPAKQ
ncbi:MAG TPA: hypothetical protein PKH10_13495, partial [bacterium]|nr:hypothetical protein [bacterium]